VLRGDSITPPREHPCVPVRCGDVGSLAELDAARDRSERRDLGGDVRAEDVVGVAVERSQENEVEADEQRRDRRRDGGDDDEHQPRANPEPRHPSR
jgi:hypothetical protein